MAGRGRQTGRVIGRVCCVGGAALVMCASGCARPGEPHLDSVTRVLDMDAEREVRLPETVDVPTAMSATRRVLRRHGFVIVHDRETRVDGRVIARAPAYGVGRFLSETITVDAWRVGRGSRLRVASGPAGEQAWADDVLSGIADELGYAQR